MYCIVLYWFYIILVLYCIVLYYIVLYCIVLYCMVLYCTVLFCIVWYCIVSYCIILHCFVLYCSNLLPWTTGNKILSTELKPTAKKDRERVSNIIEILIFN